MRQHKQIKVNRLLGYITVKTESRVSSIKLLNKVRGMRQLIVRPMVRGFFSLWLNDLDLEIK